jgi:hypothetical protein
VQEEIPKAIEPDKKQEAVDKIQDKELINQPVIFKRFKKSNNEEV